MLYLPTVSPKYGIFYGINHQTQNLIPYFIKYLPETERKSDVTARYRLSLCASKIKDL
jgi:hypothetical protein